MPENAYTVPRLRAIRVDFKVIARDNIQFHKHTGSMWRGFLKKPMRDRLCVMGLDTCDTCPILTRCGYGHIWEQPPAEALLAEARALAAHFPKNWNPTCTPDQIGGGEWGNDGYSVDPRNEANGSSVVNTWRLAMGEELGRAI